MSHWHGTSYTICSRTLRILTFLFPFLLLLIQVKPAAAVKMPGLLCSSHPAYKPGQNGVLVRSWEYFRVNIAAIQPAYFPRYTGHRYAPAGDRTSTKYAGLDFFFTASTSRSANLRMYFQRDATVYLLARATVSLANFNPSSPNSAVLPGWTSEGWATLVNGSPTFTYGVEQTRRSSIATVVYVFSRVTTKQRIDIPQGQFIMKKTTGASLTGSYHILVGEQDGSPSLPLGTFNGVSVRTNTRCPDSLHGAWYTLDSNTEDADTAGIRFDAWHPQWDPCYWCSYDHEHGSSPLHLMNYAPKYDLGAWKNGRMDESNSGFKGFVLDFRKYYIYFNAHIQTSSVRRVQTRTHTIVTAITSKETGELLMELTHKGDFGFQAVRQPKRNFVSINAAMAAIRQSQLPKSNFRSINVIDVDNLNPAYSYRNPVLIGVYEEWQTLPICARVANRGKMVAVIIKNPITGIKSVTEVETPVNLGRKGIRSDGLVRTVRFNRVTFGAQYCSFPVTSTDGYFYTDPDGERVLSGPGPDAIRQFIKPGFSLTVSGGFEPDENWVGLHIRGKRGFFTGAGYGIDPSKN